MNKVSPIDLGLFRNRSFSAGLAINITVGVGGGLVLPALIGVVLAGVDPAHAGAASGVLTTTRH